MKNFKTALASILAACAMLNLMGCSEKQNVGGPHDHIMGANDDLLIGPADGGTGGTEDYSGTTNDGGSENSVNYQTSEGVQITRPQYAPITLTDSNFENSIRLFDVISADKENAMFSPISLNMALGLIETGANGDTKTALDSYLQTKNFADFAQSYMRLAKDKYTFKDEYYGRKNVLEIANSFWADHSLPINTDYKRIVSDKFDAEIQSVDLANKDKTLDKINSWVSDKTHKMIPSILQDYSEDTAAVLINTVYFESAWANKWGVDTNKKQTFTLTDGTTKELPLMHNGGSSYFENDKATAFSSRYKNGLEFIGILPKGSGEFTLESLDIPSLLKSETRDYDVSAVMPGFTFDTAFGLKDALCAAGLDVIFDEKKADFSGISEADLWVSEILQKTRIELDENGTKAAAVTVIEAPGSRMPEPKEIKTVRLDRPFAFMIYDHQQEQILFVGKVTNP